VIEVEVEHERRWLELDVVRVFADEQEARAHAAQHRIPVLIDE
jgi:hypothetical protein